MSLLLELPRKRQPQEVVQLNPEHPLAQHCIGGWVSSQAGVLMRIGGVQALTRSGTTQRGSAQGQGTGFGAYSGTAIISLPNTDEQRLTAVDGSMVAGVSLTSLSGNEYRTIWTTRNASSATAVFIVALDGSAYSGGRVGFNISGTSDFLGTSGSAQQNAYATYGAQWGSAGRTLYVNGAVDATSANTAQIASSAIQPSLGNRQSGGRSLGAGSLLHWWFGFNTNIGDEWHARLARNPYQLIEPRRIIVPVPAAGGGGFQAAWARQQGRVIGAGVI